MTREHIAKLVASRAARVEQTRPRRALAKSEAEGGCGVIGIACSEPIPARHLLQALGQMRNRGNGKGGGIAAVGLVPEEWGVSREVLARDYLLAIAYLDPRVRAQVERDYIEPTFDLDHVHAVATLSDFRALRGLDIQPPEVWLYWARLKPNVVRAFQERNGLTAPDGVEDEIVYQNSYRLNHTFYASTGEKRAFVLSHGKNMLVLKMVGYGDDVIRYYRLEDIHAHVWIGHHRYPTKGKVWHPGGAHPFVGLHEALVHNGDFANYASLCEYLAQRHIYPLFLTDTEVSVLVFDLLHRTFGYPLEYVIEALAPTTERDFTLLPPDKQRVYQMLQRTHIHGSPDGPWFFLIAQSVNGVYRLIGITDTSMLRPQVFALQVGEVAIGFAASEKQAIDAALASLAAEDARFWTRADRYWNARGGSHTDGGAFIFTVQPNSAGAQLTCTDKFGRVITVDETKPPYRSCDIVPMFQHSNVPTFQRSNVSTFQRFNVLGTVARLDMSLPAPELFARVTAALPQWNYDDVIAFLAELERAARNDYANALETLTLLMDRRYPTGHLRRSCLLSLYDATFDCILYRRVGDTSLRKHPTDRYAFLSAGQPLPRVENPDQTLVVDGRGFAAEGRNSLALTLVQLYHGGWRRFLIVHARGHRFIGNGLGPNSHGVRIDVYGSSGDYLASGIDGAEIFVHGSAQDQLAQIMKDGRLVVYGDVGQTFMYAAKGGCAFVLGNAAGRPLINAVGKPRVVINGTCLDYLAESFMAGDPLNGGGFVILNGITFDDDGTLVELDTPYPGGNLFSLASGGAIYLRDPHGRVDEGQLNGGEFVELQESDWALIRPYLEENERLFGIPLARLLEVDGQPRPPHAVYRKIRPRPIHALQAEEAWVRMQS